MRTLIYQRDGNLIVYSLLLVLNWLNVTNGLFSSKAICSRMPGLTPTQRRICQTRPDAIAAIGDGNKLGLQECQRQFVDHRWNCSEIGLRSLFGHKLQVASRESAYLTAIRSAGVTFAVTKACSRGNISHCGCDRSAQGHTFGHGHGTATIPVDGPSWKWSGCSADIKYGMRFAKTFMDGRQVAPGDPYALMVSHNHRAGRKAVKNNMAKSCKCHGVSGSCTTKTCWKTLPPFQVIGDQLMNRYLHAKRLITSGLLVVTRQRNGDEKKQRLRDTTANSLRNVQKAITVRSPPPAPKPRDLVFLDQSPNYCDRNARLGSFGTSGRQCNVTSMSTDHQMYSCDIMCCGRGYNTHQYVRAFQCQCKFVWCCTVQCETCSELAYYHSCK